MSDTKPLTNIEDELDDLLRSVVMAETFGEVQLKDKLKRKVISKDEFDKRLLENYDNNVEEAKQALAALIRRKESEAVEKELVWHIANLALACGLTNNLPCLVAELKLAKQRIETLKQEEQ